VKRNLQKNVQENPIITKLVKRVKCASLKRLWITVTINILKHHLYYFSTSHQRTLKNNLIERMNRVIFNIFAKA